MQRLIETLAESHHLGHLAGTVLVCLLGSMLTLRILKRVLESSGTISLFWGALFTVMSGCTMWTTHFIAMLGYSPGFYGGHGLTETFGSYVAALMASGLAVLILRRHRQHRIPELGGAMLGIGSIATHYVGMAGYFSTGMVHHDKTFVAVSMVAALAFATLAINRMFRPMTNMCRWGALMFYVLSIAVLHFVGMAGMTIMGPPVAALAEPHLNADVMIMPISAVVALMLVSGLSTLMIDRLTGEAQINQLHRAARRDPLTDLPNRTALNEMLAGLTAPGRGRTDGFALAAIDLDRFKDINDMHGHAAGDHVLETVARRMVDQAGAGAMVARVGGDEFVLVMPGRGQAHAVDVCQRIIAEFASPIIWQGNDLDLGASIGLVLYPDQATNSEDLLLNADLALYEAKHDGRGQLRIFDSELASAHRMRRQLMHELRDAADRDELELLYQVQHDIQTEQDVGFEALLRWNHPARGLLPPDLFIGLAEESGLIVPIGAWVLHTACHEAATWSRPLRISVNVSAAQLGSPRFVETVAAALEASGLDPERLELEITESILINEQDRAMRTLSALKSSGVRIAMDDYGTGYSSLSALKNFPFDKIKIDRTFIDQVQSETSSAAIVRATLALGETLGIKVLAEGVETREHLDFLRKCGCSEVQGYLYGKPESATEIRARFHLGGTLDSWSRDAEDEQASAPKARPKGQTHAA